MSRQVNFELFRFLLMALVVLLHTSASYWPAEGFDQTFFLPLAIINSFTRPTVNLFYMLSGYFVLAGDLDLSKVLKKAGHFYFLFLLWSFIYALQGGYLMGADLLQGMVEGNYHLWFLLGLTWAYLWSPLFSGVKKLGRKAFTYVLCFLCLFGPIKYTLLGGLDLLGDPHLSSSLSSITLYSYNNPALLFALGGFFRIWPRQVGGLLRFGLLIVYIFLSLANGWLVALYSASQGDYEDFFFSNFNVVVFIQAICLFLFFRDIDLTGLKETWQRLFIQLSKTCFGIYLLHPLILSELAPKLTDLPLFQGLTFLWGGAFLLSLSISLLVLRLPLLGKIIR
ncbi:acyltransferase [Peptococcus simiae]|uniref:acyltransferase n=1 Tax=Peptococcus simiae TaxID=1643805 RepID=UPI00397F4123